MGRRKGREEVRPRLMGRGAGAGEAGLWSAGVSGDSAGSNCDIPQPRQPPSTLHSPSSRPRRAAGANWEQWPMEWAREGGGRGKGLVSLAENGAGRIWGRWMIKDAPFPPPLHFTGFSPSPGLPPPAVTGTPRLFTAPPPPNNDALSTASPGAPLPLPCPNATGPSSSHCEKKEAHHSSIR